MIVRVAHRTPYVVIPKATLRDPALSLEGKGFLAWLLAKPDDWQVFAMQLAGELGINRKRVARLLDELIAAGYATRQALPWEHGSQRQGYEYTVRDSTVVENGTQPLCPATVSRNRPLLNPVTDSCKKGPYALFVEELFGLHQRATGARFVFLAKHGAMVKRLLKDLGQEDAITRLRRYYALNTWFTRDGRSLEGFAAHVNEISGEPRPPAAKICPACGSPVVGTMQSCGGCGLEVSEFSDEAAIAERRAWWSSRTASRDCTRLQTGVHK